LKGLDVTVLTLSELLSHNRVFRVDSQYFGKTAIETANRLKSGNWETLGQLSARIQSFGAYALTNQFSYVDEGVPFIRGVNIKEGFIDIANCLLISKEANDLLHKSEVKPGMVLLTMSGSVGQAAVALPSWDYPVNSNQDVAKITPSKGVSPYFLTAFLNSKYGRIQAERLPVGSVQQHIFLWMLEELVIVRRFSKDFESEVATTLRRAYAQHANAQKLLVKAQSILTDALGMANWHPPEPLSYTRQSTEVFAAQRLDPQYFAPRVADLIAHLSRGGRTIRDAAPPRHEKFTPTRTGDFRYIEISDIQSDGTARSSTILMSEAPSRATWHTHAGDVLTSTVRPNRRLSAVVSQNQDGCIASSGLVVLRPQAVTAEVLLTYLRLPLLCELMDLHTSASMYPAISERDLLALPFPEIPSDTSNTIAADVCSAHAARMRAGHLFEYAKRAVELAIEKSENEAIHLLRQVEGKD
jgi:hypothetical protein